MAHLPGCHIDVERELDQEDLESGDKWLSLHIFRESSKGELRSERCELWSHHIEILAQPELTLQQTVVQLPTLDSSNPSIQLKVGIEDGLLEIDLLHVIHLYCALVRIVWQHVDLVVGQLIVRLVIHLAQIGK